MSNSQDSNNQNSPSSPPPRHTKDPKYYFADGGTVFLVDNTLFKIPAVLLASDLSRVIFKSHNSPSVILVDCSNAPIAGRPGENDENPVVIPSISCQCFRMLLFVLLSRPGDNGYMQFLTNPQQRKGTRQPLLKYLKLGYAAAHLNLLGLRDWAWSQLESVLKIDRRAAERLACWRWDKDTVFMMLETVDNMLEVKSDVAFELQSFVWLVFQMSTRADASKTNISQMNTPQINASTSTTSTNLSAYSAHLSRMFLRGTAPIPPARLSQMFLGGTAPTSSARPSRTLLGDAAPISNTPSPNPSNLTTCVGLYKQASQSGNATERRILGYPFLVLLSLGHSSEVWKEQLNRDERGTFYVAQAHLVKLCHNRLLSLGWLEKPKSNVFPESVCAPCNERYSSVWSETLGLDNTLDSSVPLEDVRKLACLPLYRYEFSESVRSGQCSQMCGKKILKKIDLKLDNLFNERLPAIYKSFIE